MADETNTTETTETQTQQTETQAPQIDEARIRRAARFNAANPEADELYWRHYAEAGGKRLTDIETKQSALQDRLSQVERDKAVERALRVYKLDESDSDFLTGKTEKDIMAQADKLAKRLAPPADKDAEESAETKQQPVLVQYREPAPQMTELERLRYNLIKEAQAAKR